MVPNFMLSALSARYSNKELRKLHALTIMPRNRNTNPEQGCFDSLIKSQRRPARCTFNAVSKFSHASIRRYLAAVKVIFDAESTTGIRGAECVSTFPVSPLMILRLLTCFEMWSLANRCYTFVCDNVWVSPKSCCCRAAY